MQASGRAKRVLIRGGLYVNILVTNHIIVYLSSQHWSQEKSQKKATIVCRLRRVDAQTKHTHHRPQCGDDVGALG